MGDMTAQTLQLTGKGMDAASRVLEAMLRILERREVTAADRAAIRDLEIYTAAGGKLMTMPLRADLSMAFEKYLEASGIDAIRTKLRTERGVCEYIFREADVGRINQILRQVETDWKMQTDNKRDGPAKKYGQKPAGKESMAYGGISR